MSEQFAPRGRRDQQAIDHLLADSGLSGDDALRTELLELRSLASTAPLPSDAVRALMVSSPVAVTQPITATQQITTTEGPSASSGAPTAVLATAAPEPAPVDELAARRRQKRRTAIAGLAVAVSLAGGATAAAASEGGLPGAFQHLGAAIGSVVSQLNPGSGSAPQPDAPAGTTPEPVPVPEAPQQAPATVQPQPAPAVPGSPAVADPQPQPGVEPSQRTPKTPTPKEPGKGVIPTPPALPVTPPEIDPSKIDPSKLDPSGIPVPVPSELIPSLPSRP
ncbi:hypothetical protein CQ020_14945 [Arthrobacter sp. MYb23]|uniref:hypothetical protein n=1 Tax=unclassified Arthrobacter TaxID=235627 RepID=UPI000CFBBE92|nr:MULTISPECIES: hypothetical protein [unclassified Arthrobacter]PRB40737.1 hypothetical protein CQ038_16100 [Arthrobacter sp. MYb51]PRB94517.1 hypothetical protein CQ020_14945 [Arthrobacter sp. MYb23]